MRALAYLLKFTCGLGLMLLVGEFYLRIAGIQLPRHTYMDREMGISFQPGKPYLKYSEGYSFGKFTKEGLKGKPRELTQQKDIRIALMGDSYTAGFQVWERGHFRHLLEQALNQDCKVNPDLSYEVMNLAMEGFDFQQMYCRYQMLKPEITPDLALFFLQSNDFTFSAKQYSPHLALEGNQVTVNTSFRQDPDFQSRVALKDNVLYNSAIFQLLGNANILRSKGQLWPILLGKFATLTNSEHKPKVSLPPQQPKSVLNGEDEEKLRLALSELGKDGVVFITFNRLLAADIEQIEALGVPVFDMSETLQQQGGEALKAWPSTQHEGHYNYQGHIVIAEFLFDLLCGRYAGKD
jgi:hypothetical protein